MSNTSAFVIACGLFLCHSGLASADKPPEPQGDILADPHKRAASSDWIGNWGAGGMACNDGQGDAPQVGGGSKLAQVRGAWVNWQENTDLPYGDSREAIQCLCYTYANAKMSSTSKSISNFGALTMATITAYAEGVQAHPVGVTSGVGAAILALRANRFNDKGAYWQASHAKWLHVSIPQCYSNTTPLAGTSAKKMTGGSINKRCEWSGDATSVVDPTPCAPTYSIPDWSTIR
jgi:hypothetical protein